LSTWYEKCIPKIKEVKSFLPEISNIIKKIGGVEKVYIWGSYAKHYYNSNFRIKDLDIIVKTNINSQDLISTDEEIIKKRCTNRYLEKLGYVPLSVKFTKKFTEFKKYNIDHWAISSDKKLLHWGPIVANKEEADDIIKEAENYTKLQTGLDRKKINSFSEKKRKNWYKFFCNYINNYFIDMPSGWYQSTENNIEIILKQAIRI